MNRKSPPKIIPALAATVTPITESEFLEARIAYRIQPRRGKPVSVLTQAVRALLPLQGFKMHCVYRHYGDSNICGGAGRVHSSSRGPGRPRYQTACRDGIFYVLRMEDKVSEGSEVSEVSEALPCGSTPESEDVLTKAGWRLPLKTLIEKGLQDTE
jgi:hypothetical protein